MGGHDQGPVGSHRGLESLDHGNRAAANPAEGAQGDVGEHDRPRLDAEALEIGGEAANGDRAVSRSVDRLLLPHRTPRDRDSKGRIHRPDAAPPA